MMDFESKTLALQLAVQLPHDRDKAYATIRALIELLENWLYFDNQIDSSSCNNLASLTGKLETLLR